MALTGHRSRETTAFCYERRLVSRPRVEKLPLMTLTVDCRFSTPGRETKIKAGILERTLKYIWPMYCALTLLSLYVQQLC